MLDRDALIAAIIANPDEDTPRLMFADWLDEHGDDPGPAGSGTARAEFIRVQIELARQRAAEADLPESFGTVLTGRHGGAVYSYRPHDTDARRALLGREARLARTHGTAWRDGLPHYANNVQVRKAVQFRRGFVGHVMSALGPLMKAPAALWEHHPVESIALDHFDGEARHKVPTCEALAALRELSMSNGSRNEGALAPYAESPHLAGIRTLLLPYPGTTLGGATALARSPYLRPISLTINCHELPEPGFAALVNGPFAARLRRFRPESVEKSWGPRALAEAPLSELRFLDLSGSYWSDEGVSALTRSKHLTQLVTLNLGGRLDLTSASLEALAAWPGLATVRSLNLGYDYHRFRGGIIAGGLAALLKAPHFRPIHLGLRNAEIGDDGARELAAWPGLANIVHLDLSYAQVAEAGVTALADSPHWRDIRYLNLACGRLGEGAADCIRKRLGKQRVETWG